VCIILLDINIIYIVGFIMKTIELIKLLEKNGWVFKRHGANHDIYIKGNERESIVRHRETDEELAKTIIKRRSLT
jgi:YcfA-like protein.